ncbi:glycosyltransferase [Bacillus andreraoultii]|uniref:glycosyltransferase n=1 Tax=Bacillus andreraoultii TaxID=1499685 RepID=UPI00053B1DD9|nr:glycosyltransferase [Bacillus andreraoultii]
MKKCLILLTNYYPFHKGEEYLESEIKYLAANFHQIYVISTMVSNDMRQTRTVPDNVIVLPVGIKHSKFRKVNMLVRQYRKIHKDEEKKIMIKEDSKGKFLPKVYCYYFESRSMEIYEKVKDKLNKYDFRQYESITIYSYWLYVTARVAVELKNNFFRGKNLYLYTLSRAHGYDINEHVNFLKFLPEREFLLRSLDNVFPVSQNGVNFLKQKYSNYKSKVEVKRLGTKKPKIKKQHNNAVLNIVSCSTVRKLKRIDLLIDSLVILKEENINFKWTHIGEGPEFDEIKMLASNKLNKHQFEFTGHMKNNEVLKWYQNTDATVFINTSASEGVPVSIMEAMSVGLPVIATNVGGTNEIIDPNKTGFLLKSNCTPEEIAEKLLYIKSMNQEDYIEMCEAAYQLWEEKCNADRLYSSFAYEISNWNLEN